MSGVNSNYILAIIDDDDEAKKTASGRKLGGLYSVRVGPQAYSTLCIPTSACTNPKMMITLTVVSHTAYYHQHISSSPPPLIAEVSSAVMILMSKVKRGVPC